MKGNQPRRKLYDAEAELVRLSFFMNEKCQKQKSIGTVLRKTRSLGKALPIRTTALVLGVF